MAPWTGYKVNVLAQKSDPSCTSTEVIERDDDCREIRGKTSGKKTNVKTKYLSLSGSRWTWFPHANYVLRK